MSRTSDIINSVVGIVNQTPSARATSHNSYAGRSGRNSRSEQALALNLSFACSACNGVIFSPHANFAHVCPHCSHRNIVFACPNCLGICFGSSDTSIICPHCRNTFGVHECDQCDYVNVITGKSATFCSNCRADIADNGMWDGNNLQYLLAVQLILFRYIEAHFPSDGCNNRLVKEQYILLLEDRAFVERVVVKNWTKVPVVTDVEAFAAESGHMLGVQDVVILVNQLLRIIAANNTISADLCDFLKQWSIGAGLLGSQFDSLVGEYFLIISLDTLSDRYENVDPVLRKYYVTLGIDIGASLSDIKRAYYDLSKKYHPDANMSASEAEQTSRKMAFVTVNEAYEILSNTLR